MILCRAREGVTIEDIPRQAGQLVPPFCKRQNECTAPRGHWRWQENQLLDPSKTIHVKDIFKTPLARRHS